MLTVKIGNGKITAAWTKKTLPLRNIAASPFYFHLDNQQVAAWKAGYVRRLSKHKLL